jgi:hypothetical protein
MTQPGKLQTSHTCVHYSSHKHGHISTMCSQQKHINIECWPKWIRTCASCRFRRQTLVQGREVTIRCNKMKAMGFFLSKMKAMGLEVGSAILRGLDCPVSAIPCCGVAPIGRGRGNRPRPGACESKRGW